MIKKFLARFGKGAATVDLRFDNSRPYYAGGVIEGEVHIVGGEVEQKVNSLAARLMMSIRTKQGSATREAAMIPLSGAFVIRPKEQKVIPFTYGIPANLPVSRETTSYYFDPGSISKAVSTGQMSIISSLMYLGRRDLFSMPWRT